MGHRGSPFQCIWSLFYHSTPCMGTRGFGVLCTQALPPSFLWPTAWAHPDCLGRGNVAPSHPRTTPSTLPPASCFWARALHLGNSQVLLTSQVPGDDTWPLAPREEEANCKARYSVAYKKSSNNKTLSKVPRERSLGRKGWLPAMGDAILRSQRRCQQEGAQGKCI